MDKPLSSLTRYYLACMGHEESDVSVFAESKHGLDYAELPDWEAVRNGGLGSIPEVQQLLKKSGRRSEKSLYLGYPCSLKSVQSKKTNWSGCFVQPLFLFPVDSAVNGSGLTADMTFPTINSDVLKRFTGSESDGLMDELTQLESELGLAANEETLPFEDMVRRLEEIRAEWPWKESVDFANLKSNLPLSQIKTEGIYNRAVLIIGDRPPFTRGLESELAALARLSESDYKHTALGQWVAGEIPYADADKDEAEQSPPLIEVVPINSEQRDAIQRALQKNLTIITGPPGTGKSQVVTNLLINAAWQGKKVLFASKNNKAVDVVETRINALGPRPVLLRVGPNANRNKLAEYLMSILSVTATADDQHDLDESLAIHARLKEKNKQLDDESAKIIDLRNQVDASEQKVEAARKQLPKEMLAVIKRDGLAEIQNATKCFQDALHATDKPTQNFLVRLLWDYLRESRFKKFTKACKSLSSTFPHLMLKLPDGDANESNVSEWYEFEKHLVDRICNAELFQGYITALRKLQQARSLESIAREQANLNAELVGNAELLWKSWLQVQPSRLSQDDRRLLSQYRATLEMAINTGGDAKLDDANKLVKKVSNLLPCWAVTSLSARNRVQFDAGFFDLVVFDEASQCDIASALPLLYRAKRAVVIGDPNQLRHISKIQRRQDRRLIEKHGLLDEHMNWSYSNNSLFDLAVGMATSEDIVTLRDHHRSHADIIEFSNRAFYTNRLRVATHYDKLNTKGIDNPGVRWVHIGGSVERPGSGGAINYAEAAKVVQVLKRLLIKQKYEGSIGVVSPFRAQANRIRQLANEDPQLEPHLSDTDFLADTVHKFQGDERDIMVFSPVLSEGISDGARNFLRNNGNLFNVAITRARAMLIVVGDKQAAAQSDIDYYSKFAEYVESLEQKQQANLEREVKDAGPEYPTIANPELVSDWEKVLYRALYKAGIVSVPQWQEEKYLLDLAIFDGERKLNVEVDGERYHRDWTGELCRRDQIRNQRMFELGWDVLRFWVYEVRDDLDGCVARVAEWLKTQSSPD